MAKSGRNCFTKIRKWAEKVGADVRDSQYFDSITITLPNGKKFEAEERESTSRQVVSRGRGLTWDGHPKGFYFTDVPEKGYGGYAFQSTQDKAIENMKKYL